MKTNLHLIIIIVILIILFYFFFFDNFFLQKNSYFSNTIQDYSNIIKFLESQTTSNYQDYSNFMKSINNTNMSLESIENYFYFYGLAKEKKLTNFLIEQKLK